MLVSLITDHVAQALGRLMQQYRDLATPYPVPLLATTPSATVASSASVAPLIAITDQMQALENAIFGLSEGRFLFDGVSYPAFGAQLDGIGTLVGIARNGLSDAEYLIFILGTIIANNSDATVAAVTTVLTLLFQVPTTIAYEFFPAEMAFQVPEGPLQESLYATVANIVISALGAGIGLGFITVYPDPTFQFSAAGGAAVGGGFGSVTQSGGGGFGGNVYNNQGA